MRALMAIIIALIALAAYLEHANCPGYWNLRSVADVLLAVWVAVVLVVFHVSERRARRRGQ